MMPVWRFVNPEKGSMEFNAVAKALREEPRVRLIGNVDDVAYYLVQKTTELGLRRIVQLWEDPDREITEEKGRRYIRERGDFWIECSCPAGTPREDVKYKTMSWLPKPCYHAAAVLMRMAEGDEEIEVREPKVTIGV